MSEESKPRILVIDDERGPRESLRMLLKHDYDVTLADSVDRGVDLLKRISPETIVLDLRMPEKGGIEGLREIREIDKDVSVVILTGYGELETAREAIHHGANEYMKKPFDAREMFDAISRNVARTRANRHRASAAERVEELDRKIKNIVGEKKQMTTLGLASSAFAHDVRNPLMIILAYVEMLSDKLRSAGARNAEMIDEDVETYLDNIEKNVNRCHKLAKDWNLLGKPDSIQFQRIALNRLIREIADDVGHLAENRGVEVVVGDLPDDIFVMAEPSLLERALFNIVKNGIQAVSGHRGGRVKISLDRSASGADIRIEDNGSGIDSDKLDWIFEPLRSDRAPGEGFGLGLFITKEVVEQHNGKIVFDSAFDTGTVVTVSLPTVSQ